MGGCDSVLVIVCMGTVIAILHASINNDVYHATLHLNPQVDSPPFAATVAAAGPPTNGFTASPN